MIRAGPTGARTGRAPGSVGPARGPARLVASGDDWVAVERIRLDGERADPLEALPEGERFELVEPTLASPGR